MPFLGICDWKVMETYIRRCPGHQIHDDFSQIDYSSYLICRGSCKAGGHYGQAETLQFQESCERQSYQTLPPSHTISWMRLWFSFHMEQNFLTEIWICALAHTIQEFHLKYEISRFVAAIFPGIRSIEQILFYELRKIKRMRKLKYVLAIRISHHESVNCSILEQPYGLIFEASRGAWRTQSREWKTSKWKRRAWCFHGSKGPWEIACPFITTF